MLMFHNFDGEIESLVAVEEPTPVIRELLEGFIILDAVNGRLFQLREEDPTQVAELVDRVGNLANRLVEKHFVSV